MFLPFRQASIGLLSLAALPGLLQADSVHLTETADHWVFSNESTQATFDFERHRLVSWSFEGRELLDNGGTGFIQVYVNRHLPQGSALVNPVRRVIHRQTEDVIDVAFVRDVSNSVTIYHHWLLRAGDPALYNYFVVTYGGEGEGAVLEQINTALRLDPQLFNFASIGPHKQDYLAPPSDLRAGRMIMDATYLLPDGEVDAKYDWTMDEWSSQRTFGLMGQGIGVFVLKDPGEHAQGGPSARNLSVHQTVTTPILLRHFVAGHYGTGRINLSPEDAGWRKLGGPWAFYPVTGDSHADMQRQADARAAELLAEWPYQWLEHPDYIHQRGEARGRLLIEGQPAPAGTLVVLSPPPAGGQPNWQVMGRDGYQFWTRVGANGTFHISKVIPGPYTLWAVSDGHFNEFRHDGVTVTADSTSHLGELSWTPPLRGTPLWQIGRPDRTSSEYRNGFDYRNWGLWLRYPDQFPHDVDFVIGSSTERYDWNYLHTAVLEDDGQWRLPEWKVRFELDQAFHGLGTLRVAVAGAVAHAGETTGEERWAGVKFALNGQPLGDIRMPNDSGSTRSGNRGRYYHFELPFDATRLQAGENVVTLQLDSMEPRGIAHAFPYAGVMYDALRLEVDPAAPAPTP
jgi:rhamnogalacturonan endolyase